MYFKLNPLMTPSKPCKRSFFFLLKAATIVSTNCRTMVRWTSSNSSSNVTLRTLLRVLRRFLKPEAIDEVSYHRLPLSIIGQYYRTRKQKTRYILDRKTQTNCRRPFSNLKLLNARETCERMYSARVNKIMCVEYFPRRYSSLKSNFPTAIIFFF